MPLNGYIPLYIRFRFRDLTGAIVTIRDEANVVMSGSTFMYFDNLEIKGRATEASRGLTEVYTTYSGNAAYSSKKQPRRFDFTINTYKAATFRKLDLLNQYLQLGYRVEFWVIQGNMTYTAVTDDLTPATQAYFAYSMVEYKDGESAHKAIKRGFSYVRGVEVPLSVYEGTHLAIPALPTAGDQEVDSISGTA